MEPLSPLSPVYIPESARMSPCRTAVSFSSQTLIPAPQVTASAWSIINADNREFLWSKNGETPHDIASLTKMMTCYLVKQCIKQDLCHENDIVTVPKEATLLGGTTAYLKQNDQLKIIDLLYGMMLPSGNDAAFSLAEHCGGLMQNDPKINKQKSKYTNAMYFVKQMNITCRRLGFKNTKFLNPHGLSHLGNQSTAIEIGKLGAALIKKPLICSIVGQVKYSCEVRNKGVPRKLSWCNTNALLGQNGVTGLKTGHTQTAGPCLCVTFSTNGYNLVVTLFKCRTPEKRWAEANRLMSWASNQLEIICQKLTDKKIRVKNLSNLMNSFDYMVL